MLCKNITMVKQNYEVQDQSCCERSNPRFLEQCRPALPSTEIKSSSFSRKEILHLGLSKNNPTEEGPAWKGTFKDMEAEKVSSQIGPSASLVYYCGLPPPHPSQARPPHCHFAVSSETFFPLPQSSSQPPSSAATARATRARRHEGLHQDAQGLQLRDRDGPLQQGAPRSSPLTLISRGSVRSGICSLPAPLVEPSWPWAAGA